MVYLKQEEDRACGGGLTDKMLTKDKADMTIQEAAEKVNSVTEFVISDDKIERFCLLPGAKHWEEFKSVGFTQYDGELLRSQFKKAFENGERCQISLVGQDIRFSIYADLGKTKMRTFLTGWQIDAGSNTARFITAHRQKGR